MKELKALLQPEPIYKRILKQINFDGAKIPLLLPVRIIIPHPINFFHDTFDLVIGFVA